MDYTKKRDEVFRLARIDWVKASEIAGSISRAWFRAQAYAALARFASNDGLAHEYAAKALAAAKRGDDPYETAGSASWALRALVDRGLRTEAFAMLAELVAIAKEETIPASRAETYLRLFHAVFPLGKEARAVPIAALLELEHTSPGWRSSRALRICCEMLAVAEPETASRIAEQIKTPNYQRQAMTAITEKKALMLRDLFR